MCLLSPVPRLEWELLRILYLVFLGARSAPKNTEPRKQEVHAQDLRFKVLQG